MNKLINFWIFIGLVTFAQLGFAFEVQKNSSNSRTSKQRSSFAAGIASKTYLLKTFDTALTGIWKLNKKSMIQGAMLLNSGDTLLYSLGAEYKYIVSGGQKLGVHVGGGLGIGTHQKDLNFIRITGIFGFHFRVHKKIVIHVDGGLVIAKDDENTGNGKTESDTVIQFGGQSAIYGLSLLYAI